MIGTVEAAREALEGDLPYLSGGSSRLAYIYDGVVYKVDRYSDWANRAEWEKYQTLSQLELDPRVALPKTHLFDIGGRPVIAMEYIDGQFAMGCWCIEGKEEHMDSCLTKEMVSILSKYIVDLGGENVFYKDGKFYIIDMGE